MIHACQQVRQFCLWFHERFQSISHLSSFSYRTIRDGCWTITKWNLLPAFFAFRHLQANPWYRKHRSLTDIVWPHPFPPQLRPLRKRPPSAGELREKRRVSLMSMMRCCTFWRFCRAKSNQRRVYRRGEKIVENYIISHLDNSQLQ